MTRNDDYTVDLATIIYGSYVKMDRLQHIVFETFANTSIAEATHLNIFIDLYSTLHPIFSEHYRVNIENYTDVTAGIINMCAHYRKFFRGLGVHTTFYLIYSDNICDFNRKFIAGYNENFVRKSQIKMFREIVDTNLDLLATMCPYLPDIHFVKSINNWESSVIMANIIETLNDMSPNLIISKDLYPIQLCALYPWTSYLYPLKHRGGIDDSIMVPLNEKPNFRGEFWKLYVKDKPGEVKTDLRDISPLNIALLSAINGLHCREINMLYNISTAKKVILGISNGEDIKIDPIQLLNDEKVSKIINVQQVESRLKGLDISFALPYYKQDPESNGYNFINLEDNGAINKINAKYFENNPLELQKL
jgi:hypothetical protein